MPIYGYLCAACGFKKDVLQKISDAPLTTCPVCDKEELSKQISAPSFRLSGSGWYETDFKTGKKKNLTGDQGKPSADVTTKNEVKTETKSTDSTKAGKTSAN